MQTTGTRKGRGKWRVTWEAVTGAKVGQEAWWGWTLCIRLQSGSEALASFCDCTILHFVPQTPGSGSFPGPASLSPYVYTHNPILSRPLQAVTCSKILADREQEPPEIPNSHSNDENRPFKVGPQVSQAHLPQSQGTSSIYSQFRVQLQEEAQPIILWKRKEKQRMSLEVKSLLAVADCSPQILTGRTDNCFKEQIQIYKPQQI